MLKMWNYKVVDMSSDVTNDLLNTRSEKSVVEHGVQKWEKGVISIQDGVTILSKPYNLQQKQIKYLV